MFKRVSLLLAISLHVLTWGGVASESALSNTPRARFSLAELFTPSTYKMSAASLFQTAGSLFQKGVVTNRKANCPPAPLYKIGEFAQGGVVIWLTEDGQHGLVAAITDAGGLSVNYQWGPLTPGIGREVQNNQSLPFSTPNFPYGEYYGGYKNQKFIANLPSGQITSYPAFQAAQNYTYTTTDGMTYDDWWLPSSTELSLMYPIREKINQVSQANGGTPLRVTRAYWSSRERENFLDSAWFLDFAIGSQASLRKNLSFAVRCVRAF